MRACISGPVCTWWGVGSPAQGFRGESTLSKRVLSCREPLSPMRPLGRKPERALSSFGRALQWVFLWSLWTVSPRLTRDPIQPDGPEAWNWPLSPRVPRLYIWSRTVMNSVYSFISSYKNFAIKVFRSRGNDVFAKVHERLWTHEQLSLKVWISKSRIAQILLISRHHFTEQLHTEQFRVRLYP